MRNTADGYRQRYKRIRNNATKHRRESHRAERHMLGLSIGGSIFRRKEIRNNRLCQSVLIAVLTTPTDIR